MNDDRQSQRFAGASYRRVRIKVKQGDLAVAWSDDGMVEVHGPDVAVTDLGDELEIERRHGNDRLEVRLPATIEASSISTERGRLELHDARGQVEASSGKGAIHLHGGQGDFSLRTGSGTINADDVRGPLSAKTGSGEVRLDAIDGPAEAATGSGNITVSSGSGDVRGRTGSGNIRVDRRASGRVALTTGSGNVSLTDGQSSATEVTTGSGNILCSARIGPDRHAFTSGSGNIAVAIPRGLAARIDATTSSGAMIHTDLPLVTVSQRGPKSLFGRRLVGSLGEGTPRAEISVRTSRGDIRLDWLDDESADRAPLSPRERTEDSAVFVPVLDLAGEPILPVGDVPGRDEPRAADTMVFPSAEIPMPPATPGPSPAPGDLVSPAPVLPIGRIEPAFVAAPTPPTRPAETRADEQRRVLAALASGEVTVTEAEDLLAALDETPAH